MTIDDKLDEIFDDNYEFEVGQLTGTNLHSVFDIRLENVDLPAAEAIRDAVEATLDMIYGGTKDPIWAIDRAREQVAQLAKEEEE